MKETALVIKENGKHAVVSIDKKDECSKCGMCAFPKNANKIELNAKNGVGAKVGDTVIVERAQGGKLTGAILVFLVPLILIGISALINHFFIGNDLWFLGLAVIFIAVWYAILAIIDKKLVFMNKYLSVIIQVVQPKYDIETINEQEK